jgi:DNA-binding PadR family transcriptional regulator
MNAHGPAPEDPAAGHGRPCSLGPGRALTRLEPWLLLLLAEHPAHGYELLERLAATPEAPDADRGHLYRTLRRLEDEGLVTSAWQMPQTGAPRHTYTLTADGVHALDAWATHIDSTLRRLECFLRRRQALGDCARPPESHPTAESSCRR